MNYDRREYRARSIIFGGSAGAVLAAGTLATAAGFALACSSPSRLQANNSDGGTSGNGEGGADAGEVNEPPPTVTQPDCRADPKNWPMFGQNLCNTASSPSGAGMSRQTARALAVKWVYAAAGDVSATPAVADGSVYVPDWAGMITRLDAATGTVTWSQNVTSVMASGNVSTLTGFLSRNTPVVTSDSVIFGTGRGSSLLANPGPSAYVVSIDKNTGAFKWATDVSDGHVAAGVTGSAVYDGKRLYFGVASSEEAFPHFLPSYNCCTFRGSIVAVDAATGSIVWKTHTISDALYYQASADAGAGDGGSALSGFSGVGVWSSTPVVDFKRKLIYATTGNSYSAPSGAPGTQEGDYLDAILALDMDTGAVRWAQSVPEGGRDVWSYANLDMDASAAADEVDSDFGSGPNFFTATIDGAPKDIVGAGQKSGVYYAVDAATGHMVWQTQVGPGGHVGGIHWGTATDGNRIYVGVNDMRGAPWVLGGKGGQAGKTVTTGAWAALDPATGAILWQVADPAMQNALNGATVNGPITVANGVVFGGSMDAMGTMFALDAATGEVLWSFKSGGTVYGGPAIAGGVVYWGSGYPIRIVPYAAPPYGIIGGFGTPSKKLYAFAAP